MYEKDIGCVVWLKYARAKNAQEYEHSIHLETDLYEKIVTFVYLDK